MKKIDQSELYENLSGFLKSKGIALNDGSYTARIRRGCSLLADAVNVTQETVTRVKVQVDRNMDRLRETIHKATAPKGASKPAAATPAAAAAAAPASSVDAKRKPAKKPVPTNSTRKSVSPKASKRTRKP